MNTPAPATRSRLRRNEALSAEIDSAQGAAAPQRVSPGSARSILMTLLGEFVMPRARPVWTSTLVYVLVGVGIAEKAARQAIARAATSGWITSNPVGRRTCWTLTERGRNVINEGAERVHSMGQRRASWDGRWLVLTVNLPDSQRALRLKLARALNWVGFGNPTPSLWVTPHTGRVDEARQVIQKLRLEASSLAFVGPSVQLGQSDHQLVHSSWDLATVQQHYDALIKRFTKLRPQSGDSMLFAHAQLVNAWQTMPFIDPGLPIELLPPGWDGHKAAARLEHIREQWREAAHTRWDEVAGVLPSI